MEELCAKNAAVNQEPGARLPAWANLVIRTVRILPTHRARGSAQTGRTRHWRRLS